MSFNLDDYIDVAERIKLAKECYPEMSLQPANPLKPFEIVSIDGKTFVVYTAALYRDPADATPAMGCAWEAVPGLTPYTRGSELMNAETSAWGRAIIAAGIPSKKIASREEVMARSSAPIVERLTHEDVKASGLSAWDTGRLVAGLIDAPVERDLPYCHHGVMKEKKGISAKTGKDYLGYVCVADKPDQCPPVWYILGSNGQWRPQD